MSEELVVGLTFVDSEGEPVVNATISIVDLPSGLSIYGWSDFDDGNYSFIVDPNQFGTYLVTVSATKMNHQSGFASFSIVVDEIGTELVRLNGTSDAIRIGDDYLLVLRYADSNGITIIDVTPSIGLGVGNATFQYDGQYAILLNPTLTRTFTIVLRANLTNYVAQFTTFTLTVSEIPTILTVDKSEGRISIDQQYTVQFNLTDDEGHGLEGAIIFPLNPSLNLIFSSSVNISSGVYTITINAFEIGSYQIAFRATLSNYQNSTAGFTLTVRTIPTNLEISGNIEEYDDRPFQVRVIIPYIF